MIQHTPMIRASKKRFSVLISLGIALGAFTLLAISLSQMQVHSGHPIHAETTKRTESSDNSLQSQSSSDNIFGSLLKFGLLLLLPLSIIYLFLSPEARRRVLRDVAVITSFLLLLYLLANVFQPGGAGSDEILEEQSVNAAMPFEDPPSPGDFVTNPPSWFTFGVSFIVIAIILAIAALLWSRWRARSALNASPLDKIVSEAQDALQELRSGANLKETVIRCYYEMCQTFSKERGIDRHKGMTPREFEQHLARAGLRNEHVQKLTRLFEGVRYGDQLASQKMEREAVLCLEAIVHSYARPA